MLVFILYIKNVLHRINEAYDYFVDGDFALVRGKYKADVINSTPMAIPWPSYWIRLDLPIAIPGDAASVRDVQIIFSPLLG